MINLNNIIKISKDRIKLLTKKGIIFKNQIGNNKGNKESKFIENVLTDLQKNHNHSWYEELYDRNKNNLGDIALFYRGTEITYGKMFNEMIKYAKSLKSLNIKKKTEIPICMSNCPEFVYLLGAISMIGAKANVFSDDYDRDYITKIINECDSNIIFVEDNFYNKLKESIETTKIEQIYMTTLATSITEKYDQYKDYDHIHNFLFWDKTSYYVKSDNNIYNINTFIKKGVDFKGDLIENVDLDDEFTVTYSSGTVSNTPKPIVHTVRSFITIGRCHDPEIQKTTSMKNFIIQAHIPTFSNTDIIASISDSLMQGSKLALEPIYNEEFFLSSLMINKPNYVVATRSYWISTMKKVLYDENYKNIKLPSLLIPFSVGEPLERGEEKLINKGLRKVSAGKNIIPLPISPVKISIAGGDCEHGGIFWLLYRSYQNMKLPGKQQHGLNAFQMVEYAVLDEDGYKCEPYEFGRLVANSPCTMKEYKNNKEATDKFFIKDADGKVWGDCNVYSYIDSLGSVHMKGRIPQSKNQIPSYVYSDVITLDTKNVLSCEIVNFDDDIYVAHIEKQPESKMSDLKFINTIEKRCEKELGEEYTSKLVYRIHTNKEGFELTHSGKRDTNVLGTEGIDKSIKVVNIDNELSYITAYKYLDSKNIHSNKVKNKK